MAAVPRTPSAVDLEGEQLLGTFRFVSAMAVLHCLVGAGQLRGRRRGHACAAGAALLPSPFALHANAAQQRSFTCSNVDMTNDMEAFPFSPHHRLPTHSHPFQGLNLCPLPPLHLPHTVPTEV